MASPASELRWEPMKGLDPEAAVSRAAAREQQPSVPAGLHLPLCDLALGRSARVCEVVAPDPRIGQRLLDLGFVPGSSVVAVRRAPLGDPVAYQLRGSLICLRRSEAACIRVAPA